MPAILISPGDRQRAASFVGGGQGLEPDHECSGHVARKASTAAANVASAVVHAFNP
jgi:hypothetical protein